MGIGRKRTDVCWVASAETVVVARVRGGMIDALKIGLQCVVDALIHLTYNAKRKDIFLLFDGAVSIAAPHLAPLVPALHSVSGKFNFKSLRYFSLRYYCGGGCGLQRRGTGTRHSFPLFYIIFYYVFIVCAPPVRIEVIELNNSSNIAR